MISVSLKQALTLSLTLLAPHATLIFKIFLSPLDPRGAMLRSQLELFFQAPPACSSSDGEGDSYEEFDEMVGETRAERSEKVRDCEKVGFDREGRRGGVWVRKPRSSRKGSGGESVLMTLGIQINGRRGIYRVSEL